MVIRASRQAAFENKQLLGVTSSEGVNSKGELDLQPVEESVGLKILTGASVVSMLAMILTSQISLTWGLITMTTTSLTLGPVLGMIMLSVDENDGLSALQLPVLVTFAAGVIGSYSGIDFSGMGVYLCAGLLGLILLRLVMLLTNFASSQRRAIAMGGASVFALLLVHLFMSTSTVWGEEQDLNNWEAALQISVSLYLDIINLFLEMMVSETS